MWEKLRHSVSAQWMQRQLVMAVKPTALGCRDRSPPAALEPALAEFVQSRPCSLLSFLWGDCVSISPVPA